jgi:hypothetical protein
MVSPTPLSPADLDTLDAACAARGFTVLASSRVPASDARLAAILAASTSDALTIAATDATFDYQPPTDARPFFFNMLKPRAWLAGMVSTDGGVIAGNLRATGTLVAILAVSLVFVAGAIVLPLVVRGRPALPAGSLAAGLAYFTLIGTAFMCAQVAFLQRFSVLLGHPTYALVVVLFSMILFAGLGSFVSDRVVGARGERFGLFTWIRRRTRAHGHGDCRDLRQCGGVVHDGTHRDGARDRGAALAAHGLLLPARRPARAVTR